MHLCEGAARIHRAPCESLRNVKFVQDIVQGIGLAPDARGNWLYGNATRFVRSAGGKGGLWQDPLQLSAALVHLATSPRIPPIFTYIEVGVFSAWTCVVISAFLSRITPLDGPGFRGAAVDIMRAHVSAGTMTLLTRHNVTFVYRSELPRWLDALPSQRAMLDLCFIDADHSYKAVRSDYISFAPRCRAVMLHDIQDATTMKLQMSDGGGVPSLWHALKASMHASRVAAFTEQHSTQAPMFGIGVIAPHERTGTAEPNDASVLERWGESGEAAWRSLCRAAPPLCRAITRLRLPGERESSQGRNGGFAKVVAY